MIINRVKTVPLLLSATFFSLSPLVQAEEYTEPGRHGVQLSVTEDTVFGGYVYRTEKLDLIVNFSGHSYVGANQPYSWPINFHVGYRFNLQNHNYLAAGLAANFVLFGTDYGSGNGNQLIPPNPSTATGVDMFGMGRYGTYISLQRHFPHSNIMIELATMPYAYQINIMNIGGTKTYSYDHRFFESGFVGIAYLFGASGDDAPNKKTE